jgi:hypothetical protein
MSTVIVQLAPATEQRLRHQANELGQTLEEYLEQLAEQAVANGAAAVHVDESVAQPSFISDPRPSPAEFERLLNELAVGPPLPILPADFSRADIYDDHD